MTDGETQILPAGQLISYNLLLFRGDVIEMRSGWVLTPNPEPFSLFDKK